MAIVSLTNSVHLWIFERILSGSAKESLIRLKSVTPYWLTGSGSAVYFAVPSQSEKNGALTESRWWDGGREISFWLRVFLGYINMGVDIFHRMAFSVNLSLENDIELFYWCSSMFILSFLFLLLTCSSRKSLEKVVAKEMMHLIHTSLMS